MAMEVGLDLGTSSVLVFVKGRGIVLKEPALIAYDRSLDMIRAVGEEAYMMLSRGDANLTGIHPIRRGIIADYRMTEEMVRYFVSKAIGRRSVLKPKVCLSVPSEATQVEMKAVLEAGYSVGARDVLLVEEPVAAALGAGIDAGRPAGSVIVDIGAGKTDIGVISLGYPVVSRSEPIGGDDFTQVIVDYVRKNYEMMISESQAEEIKIRIGTLYPLVNDLVMEVTGRSSTTGMPVRAEISSEEIREALKPASAQIVEAIHAVLEKTPPELCADILARGIILTGGGARMRGLEPLINARTNIRTMTAKEPDRALALGIGKFLSGSRSSYLLPA
ncbi:MAG: rod shape-determining protein [Lachnospiraceae bacterium]|nr:rod shape-determining protein [Lachnospiraceae bacterium]